jgi:CRP-like cAMP-binding protein
MMDTERLCAILEHAPLGKALDDGERAALVDCASLRTAEPGTWLIEQGAPSAGLMVLADGRVSVRVKATAASPEHELATLEPGAVMGESGLLGERPAAAGVVTSSPVSYLLVERSAFFALAETRPAAACKIALGLARTQYERLHQMNEKVAELLDRSAGKADAELGELARFREKLLTEWDF